LDRVPTAVTVGLQVVVSGWIGFLLLLQWAYRWWSAVGQGSYCCYSGPTGGGQRLDRVPTAVTVGLQVVVSGGIRFPSLTALHVTGGDQR
jgi:hypothetical protein